MSISKNEYLRARRDVIDVKDPVAGDLTVPGWIAPLPPERETRRLFNNATLGERTDAILARDIGLSSSDLERLRKEGVI